MNIKKSKAIAFSSMLTAASVIIMLVGGFFEIFDMASAMAASFCVIFTVIELGKGYAIGVYLASSVLAFLLLPSKSAGLFFAAFFGLYPIIKSISEKRKKIISRLIKLSFFVISEILTAFLYIKLFLDESTVRSSWYIFVFAGVLGIVTFIIYDVTLTYSITAYIRNLRSKFGISRLMK